MDVAGAVRAGAGARRGGGTTACAWGGAASGKGDKGGVMGSGDGSGAGAAPGASGATVGLEAAALGAWGAWGAWGTWGAWSALGALDTLGTLVGNRENRAMPCAKKPATAKTVATRRRKVIVPRMPVIMPGAGFAEPASTRPWGVQLTGGFFNWDKGQGEQGYGAKHPHGFGSLRSAMPMV